MHVYRNISYDKKIERSNTENGGVGMTKKHVKSVSFNLKDEIEQQIWKYVSKRNFSGYVKKLIIEDMKRKTAEKKEQVNTAPVQEKKSISKPSTSMPRLFSSK